MLVVSAGVILQLFSSWVFLFLGKVKLFTLISGSLPQAQQTVSNFLELPLKFEQVNAVYALAHHSGRSMHVYITWFSGMRDVMRSFHPVNLVFSLICIPRRNYWPVVVIYAASRVTVAGVVVHSRWILDVNTTTMPCHAYLCWSRIILVVFLASLSLTLTNDEVA